MTHAEGIGGAKKVRGTASVGRRALQVDTYSLDTHSLDIRSLNRILTFSIIFNHDQACQPSARSFISFLMKVDAVADDGKIDTVKPGPCHRQLPLT